ncbi:MAG: ATP-binding cassette domain-containing protein [Holophagales bacterium]|nr:ATP-binding cassette domain-containing protein [Holophagales bacterium]MYG29259.1 ATP-binding cassette domain-containing protein [Holophagales bacterium]MYI81171.1 ATP-binding cassette domain-containing protein [Holophagales bacterium]
MRAGLDTLAIRRPLAVTMFFVALVMLGGFAWQRLPVELFPALTGDSLYVSFFRPGSEPETIEREILMPLEARVRTLPRVAETWGEVSGAAGSFTVRFERGVDLKVRELEMRRIAADLARTQPRDAFLNVQADDTSVFSSFAMILQVTGSDDEDALYDLVDEMITPRLAAVPGVSQAMLGGGASRQLTVWVDPNRCAALGVTTEQVTAAVRGAAGRLRYLGSLEDEAGRTAVMLDGRPAGPVSMGDVRVVPDLPVLVRHVADVEIGSGRRQMLYRVNGEPSVGVMVFQEEGANLVRLGRDLRRRIDEINEEFTPLGIRLFPSFDAADLVETQIDRLRNLGLSGFGIALLVLFLFLRQWRAVAVVAVAVPVSLAVALSFLYVAGLSLNLFTLFGLAIGVGLIVDNSVVVFESVQRRLERGRSPDDAAAGGIRRTGRAIVAASVTTAIVFLPAVIVDLESSLIQNLIALLSLAILLPLFGSLLVAIGLVPLLARHLAAPAAIRRLTKLRRRRERFGGLVPPDPTRILFAGVLASALRRPASWITGVVTAVVLSVIAALFLVASSGPGQAPIADQVQLSVRLPEGRGSLDSAVRVFERLETIQEVEGVDRVESMIREEGGSLTVHLVDEDERPEGLTARRVRQLLRPPARRAGAELLNPGEGEGPGGRGGGGGGRGGGAQELLGGGPSRVVLSGNDNEQLTDLAAQVTERLREIEGIASAYPAVRPGPDELHVSPNRRAFDTFGVLLDEVLPMLNLAGREGTRINTGYPLASGRELPIVVQRLEDRRDGAESSNGSGVDRDVSLSGLQRLRVSTGAGVLPVAALAQVRQAPPSPVITHHNGVREREVFYTLSPDVPRRGPARDAFDRSLDEAIASIHRPAGTTIALDRSGESTNWFRRIVVPVVLLVFLVLAVTFESMTLPILVLIALPLALLGSVWALVLTGIGFEAMALLGALVLLGLAINPAVLLVDRMQQHTLGAGWSAGAAALAAVRERARPVLMTSATTVAALAPLSIATGRENEIWPPFATLVIGGLLTATLLTLLVIPVGFVFLRRLDELFSRVGPWVVLTWLGAVIATTAPLFAFGVIESMFWQVTTTVLIAGALLGLTVWLLPKPPSPEPETAAGPPRLVVRHLRKTYGLPGPVRRALRATADFARRVAAQGGQAFEPADARDRLLPLLLLFAGAIALAARMRGGLIILGVLIAILLIGSRLLREIRRARGRADDLGRVAPGGIEGVLTALLPWALLAWLVVPEMVADPEVGGFIALGIVSTIILLVQLGRRTARLETMRRERRTSRRRRARGWRGQILRLWRAAATKVFGLDLPIDTVRALAAVSFEVERGMVGVLGPNGAGKTTLLRQLTGILDSTRGRITLGGVPLLSVRTRLARYVGYLPQDAGLPPRLTARQYLEYYAALYQIDRSERTDRISTLLREVGLDERADEQIGGYSGGMRQRVAVARTLLRLPPIIVVDEPTVGLDPRERVRFRNLLSRLAKDRIVLFSTHVVEDVAVACDRVLVLSRGRMVFDGHPAALSREAEGRVWSWRTADEEEVPELPEGAVLADQKPEPDGTSSLRVLASGRPDERAAPAEPTLEDGYLWLARAARTEAPA